MSWTVTEESDNVHKIRFAYGGRDFEQYVLLCSDVHLDNAKCKRDLLKKHLDQAKERNAPVICIGDLLDLMQSKSDRRQSKKALMGQHMRDDYLNAVIDDAYDVLSGYPIAVLGYGNHETSIISHHGTDLLKILAEKLGCYTGGYRGFIKFMFEYTAPNSKGARQSVKMYYDHGSGGGGPVTKGAIKTNRRSDMVDGVEIIASGHIHEAFVMERLKFVERAGKVYHRTVFHVQCPTYKEEIASGASGWAVEKGMPPKPLGAWWVKFTRDSNRIKVSLERAD